MLDTGLVPGNSISGGGPKPIASAGPDPKRASLRSRTGPGLRFPRWSLPRHGRVYAEGSSGDVHGRNAERLAVRGRVVAGAIYLTAVAAIFAVAFARLEDNPHSAGSARSAPAM